MTKFGKTFIRDGAYPEKHELETAWFLNSCGKDIEFLVPVRSKGIHTADIVMDGLLWEIKCPTGKGKRTIDNNFKTASKQSANLIFDLRKIRLPEEQCLSKLKIELKSRNNIKRLLVISKNNIMLD
ncbi:MAG: hypothetical protein LBL00_05035 [Endomicrobium sp.]|jgi:hypothetical protein|nr:hypothetical protein [Endomicrobium sp.]